MPRSTSPRTQRSLSASAEHYLRAIAELREERGYARVVDIATRVGVTKGTVSLTLAQLAERGLVRFDPAHFPVLTAAGRRIAADVRGRFAIIRAFLAEVVGLAPERAMAEACRWEHVVSHEVADRLLDFLRFGSESPRFAAALAEFRLFHRSCAAGQPCSTCRARGPVAAYCPENPPLVLPPSDSD
ncbi:MAG TPA: metal-dependent transcriptional regulator [Polyangiaceae bacterium]|nr:metal-dependent transcriptional regulator [Polyangiaceae bacterium]